MIDQSDFTIEGSWALGEVTISDEICEEREYINVEKDTDDSGLEDVEDAMYRKFVEKTYQVIERIEEMGFPQPNEQLKLITFRSFNAVHFLRHIALTEGVKHCAIVVYLINAEAAKNIDNMIEEGHIGSATILMSNLRNKAHREKEQIVRDMFVANEKIDLFFCSSHAKIISMETKAGNFYTVEGSGNLSYNSRVEQYTIDNDEKLYHFTREWMDRIKVFLKDKKELVLT